MGTLRTKTIEPATGSTLTLGASGDTVTVSSDSIKTNTFKDAGGNTLFTSDGAGTLSSINSGLAGGGGPILISTATASGDATVSITSGINSTYDEYMFVMTDIGAATDNVDFTFNMSTDGGSNYNVTKTTTAWYADHDEGDGGVGMTYRDGLDLAQSTAFQILADRVSNAADESLAGILHLFSPSGTTYVKQFYARVQQLRRPSNPLCSQHFTAGYGNTTSAVNAISFKMTSGNFDGTIQMYGIK